MRFSLLESVRTYALELLEKSGEEEILRRRHRTYFEALLEQAQTPLLHSDPIQNAHWLKVIQLDLDNLRVALKWCQQDPGGAVHGLNMAGTLRYYFEAVGLYQEGRQHLATALAHSGVTEEEQGAEYQKALNHAGILASYMGDWKEDKKTDIGLSAKGAVEGVKYDRVGVVLINAVQEQHIKMLSEQLETQEKKVADQRREIDSLRNSICALLPKATVCNQ